MGNLLSDSVCSFVCRLPWVGFETDSRQQAGARGAGDAAGSVLLRLCGLGCNIDRCALHVWYLATKNTKVTKRSGEMEMNAGRFLDRINRIDRIFRTSRKEVVTIPLSNSNYFLQLYLNLVNPV